MSDFKAQLEAAKAAGKAAIKTRGASIRSIVSRMLDSGEKDEMEILRTVIEEKGDGLEWISKVPDHDLMVVLKRWGSVKNAMTLWRKARITGG